MDSRIQRKQLQAWLCRCFAGALLLSFLSFGLLGYVLYYAAYPVVGVAYPHLSTWRPDTMWPLIVGAGLVWSFSFIPAGVIDHALAGRGVARLPRLISYVAVLWLGAVAAWLLVIATSLPPLRH